uniref:Uncharacterized protein n=1 Tax=Pseudictyota dubia TaxID=2749911 RepID=A0A7R9W3B1_9STRA|mmetsp:Transcript_31568/g.58186  ORF Transcript_31568/g.58186 Transcript_31568/m.58186 type:complete len:167 (+) Transcript_31568:167-667(+)
MCRGLKALVIAVAMASGTSAFVPSSSARGCFLTTRTGTDVSVSTPNDPNKLSEMQRMCDRMIKQQPAALRRQRRSVSSVQTMSLFGLGGPEIAIILIAAAFLLGPQQLANIGKDAGKFAGEFKNEWQDVPAEFKKGFEEGQIEAKASQAKEMDPLPPELSAEKEEK